MFEGYADQRPPTLLEREPTPLPVRERGAALPAKPPLPSQDGLDLFRPAVAPEPVGGQRRVAAFFGRTERVEES
ncbi:hypothetical protein [Streptomyces sp. NPDC001436]